MKKLLLSLTMVLAMFAAQAQNITVTEMESGNVVANGASYASYGLGNDWNELFIEFNITPNENMKLVGKKIENNVVEGSLNYICFGQCLAPTVYETSPIDATAGEPLLFSAHFMAEEDYTLLLGQEQSMTYEIWDVTDPDAKFVINITFKYSLDGVEEISAGNVISAYPTPATDVINFDYNVNDNAMVVIYNMMGQEMMRNEINGQNGTLKMNVSNLGSGVYFYSLVVNGRTEKSSKFVVK